METSSRTLPMRVLRRDMQAQAVAVVTLVSAANEALPAYTAGAHVDVHLPGGLMRQYSLCGDPGEHGSYRLVVLRDPASRGGSVAVHDTLVEGARVTISEPRNHFPLAADAPYSVLVGGGIGITPMIAMAWELHAADRPFELHYCARSRSQAALLDELTAVPWAGLVRLHLNDETSAWEPEPMLRAAPAGRHLYVCGPAGFMDWVMSAARDAGLAPPQIHREYFAAPAQAAASADIGFELVAQASGKRVRVEPGQTILQALRSIGVQVTVSCEEGVCGTCLCNVIEGEPDHRDVYLTDEEKQANDQMLVCCSSARSARLVLDI